MRTAVCATRALAGIALVQAEENVVLIKRSHWKAVPPSALSRL
ncbi:unnamed protein product [Mycetohabitans rhizoxinica HKI 454]|uniref:Uncharacterized protein n=1 Tax=Mycetohabitans rhizoxinica (strain DSM 19002 / CIP 109453 / HKI 454) TaxID=882378 RepID=E5AMH4_MYCRK|nr:unnamed protein product [Mycetohabitans rhizoxinica HKI 454]